MKTINLNKIIKKLAERQGVLEYRIDKMSLSDGNFEVTPEGELVHDKFIDIVITPTKARVVDIPITFTVKREEK